MGIEYAPLAASLLDAAAMSSLSDARQRGENLGKCLHPTATPHSESKKKELGSCIITSPLVGPQFFHNWFLFTGKVNKTYQCKNTLHQSQEFFSSDFRPSDLHHSKGLLKISVPHFFFRQSYLAETGVAVGGRERREGGLSGVSARPHPLLKTVRFMSKKPGFQLTTDSSSHLWHVNPLFSSTSFSLWWIKSESSLFQFSWSISHSAKPPSIRRSLHFFIGRKN